jgi:antitoxin PrlF
MRLTEGERVVFTVLDDGTTVIRAKSRSLVELKGMLKNVRGRKNRIPIAEMNIGRS